MDRKPYPSDESDKEWAFIAPYLRWMTEDAPQRRDSLREVFNGLRWIGRTGVPWRMMPHDLPPWYGVDQQAQRGYKAGGFEAMVHDLRVLLRLAKGKKDQPAAAMFDGRTRQSTPESGERAGYDGYKRKKGSTIHMAVDTLGYLLALKVTPANAQARHQVHELAAKVQEGTGGHVDVAFVDQGYTGEQPKPDAQASGIELVVVKVNGAKKGFVLLPRRWVVERGFGWMARFRCLVRDYERAKKPWLGFTSSPLPCLCWPNSSVPSLRWCKSAYPALGRRKLGAFSSPTWAVREVLSFCVLRTLKKKSVFFNLLSNFVSSIFICMLYLDLERIFL